MNPDNERSHMTDEFENIIDGSFGHVDSGNFDSTELDADQSSLRATFVCLDEDDRSVYIMPSFKCSDCGRPAVLTIGVLDQDDHQVFSRDDCCELVDLSPSSAVRLARFLLDYATEMIDDETEHRHEDTDD